MPSVVRHAGRRGRHGDPSARIAFLVYLFGWFDRPYPATATTGAAVAAMALVFAMTGAAPAWGAALGFAVGLGSVMMASWIVAQRQSRRGPLFAVRLPSTCRRHVVCRLGMSPMSTLYVVPQDAGVAEVQNFRSAPRGHGAGRKASERLIRWLDGNQIRARIRCSDMMVPAYQRAGFRVVGRERAWVYPLQRKPVFLMERAPMPLVPDEGGAAT